MSGNHSKSMFQIATYIVSSRNAGFFIYIDLSPYLPKDTSDSTSPPEFTLAQKFVNEGVFLHPCEEHGNIPGWFRLVYAQEEDVLREGLRRYVTISSVSQSTTF